MGKVLHRRSGPSARMYREFRIHATTTEIGVSIPSHLVRLAISALTLSTQVYVSHRLIASCLRALHPEVDCRSVSFIDRGALILAEALVLGVTWCTTYRQARDSAFSHLTGGSKESFAATLLRSGEWV